MEKIIYAKCSMERNPRFQIVTTICENNEKKYICKSAASKNAQNHLCNLKSFYEKKKYSLDNVSLNKILDFDGERIVFEYVDGTRLTDIISGHIEANDMDAVIDDIKLMKDIIFHTDEEIEFEETNEFNDIFGSLINNKKYMASKYSDIDILTDNVIKQDDKYVIIDYEWNFNFPIPLKFVFYRTLFHNGSLNLLDDSVKSKIYQLADIDEKDIENFFSMELNFQKYVTGESLTDLYNKMGESAYKFNMLPLQTGDIRMTVRSEDESIFSQRIESLDGKITLDVSERDDILIYPSKYECIVKIVLLNENGAEIRPIDYTAELEIVNDYYFGPAGCIKFDVRKYNTVNINYYYYQNNNEFIVPLANALKDEHKRTLEIKEIEKWRDAYKDKAEQEEIKNNELNQQMIGMQEKIASVENELNSVQEELNRTLKYKLKQLMKR